MSRSTRSPGSAPRVCGDDPRLREARGERERGAPRVCGDDPIRAGAGTGYSRVLPAYAGMILFIMVMLLSRCKCSPRMRG